MEHRQSLLPAILVCGLHASLLVPLAGCEEETTEQAVSVSLSLRPSRLNAALRDADTPFGEQGTLDITVAGLEQGELVILSRSTSGDVVGIRQVGSVVYGTAEAKPPTLLTGLPLRNGVEKVLLVCLEGPDDPAGADLEAEVEVSVWQGAKKLALASQLVRCFYSDPDFYQLSLALEPERQQAGLAIEAKATAFDDAGKVVFNEQLRFSVIGGIVQGQLATEEVTLLQRTGKDGTARIDITCPEASGIGVVEVHYEKELYAEVPGLRKTFSCFSERGDTALEIVSDREEVKADGVSTVRLMLKVLDELGVPQVAVPVMVTVNRGSLQPDPSYRGADEPIFTGPQAMRILTNDEGDASFLLLGGTEAGMARVIARATINPLGGEYSVSLEEEKLINVVGLGSIQFIGVEPPVLGVRGSGHNEQATVRFQVFNHDGKPFPAGTQVSFRIAQQSEVDPQRSHAPHLSPSVAATDGEGKVSTQLFSGTEASPVSIRASVSIAEGAGLQADSPAIPIIGVYPTSRGFTFLCAQKNIGALIDADEINSRIQQLIPCTVQLSDRFGNPVGMATSISFRSEAGAVYGTVTTPAMQGGLDGGATGLGRTTTLVSTFGILPKDVEPLRSAGLEEPYQVLDSGRKANPRDGLVTIIAFTQGEEWFHDRNGDGHFTPGEPFEDLAEPFVDENDNGIRDPTEPYIDLAIGGELPNLTWDGPNGQWDGNTTIWTETRILYSGLLDQFSPEVGFVGVDLAAEHPAFILQKQNEQEIVFHAQDVNGNILNPSAVYRISVTGSAELTVLRNDPDHLPDSWGIGWKLRRICSAQGVCYRESFIDSFGLFADQPSRSGYDMHMFLVPTVGLFECCCGLAEGAGDFFRSVLREEDRELEQCQPARERPPGPPRPREGEGEEEPGEGEVEPEATCDNDPLRPRSVFQETEVMAVVTYGSGANSGQGGEYSDTSTTTGLSCGALRYSDNRSLEQRLNVCVTGTVVDEDGRPLTGGSVQLFAGQEAGEPVPISNRGTYCTDSPRGRITLVAFREPDEELVIPCSSDPLEVEVEGLDHGCGEGALGCFELLVPLVCKEGEPPLEAEDQVALCAGACADKASQCMPPARVLEVCQRICPGADADTVACVQQAACAELAPNPGPCDRPRQ